MNKRFGVPGSLVFVFGGAVMIQEVVWAVSIVLMGALAAVFAWVAAGANVALAHYGPVVDSAYRLRTWLFALVFLILIAVTYQTLGRLPYASRQGQLPVVGVQRVDAISEQWS